MPASPYSASSIHHWPLSYGKLFPIDQHQAGRFNSATPVAFQSILSPSGPWEVLLVILGLPVPVPPSDIRAEFWTVRSGRNTVANRTGAEVSTLAKRCGPLPREASMPARARTDMLGRAARVALRLSVHPRPLPLTQAQLWLARRHRHYQEWG
ncbi:hypothetical protein CORC01_01315 [Colletotrichum orchidophilum]|uniref:Uncharacterized protein n=1 Tax=Colletotrichum orchidophilum TaxID=1209926 RepID=A0A1G4BP74_9PEZI|nr:uncharacterized protein CORC01_01315 [Colletotrichum orchidophilum]OHF03262.1 hypothetical protein CORC01_01315 [Colletotrichum orchidophilum]